MFNKYYQEELAFLREMGQEFAKAHPQLAPYLAQGGSDPDVERLLEGFAFLTGRIRQKLDDELPELTHTLIDLLWPHYLRPIPSMGILKFDPVWQAFRERHRIPRGAKVASVPVEGTPCQFATCYDVDIYPIILADVVWAPNPAGTSELKLKLRLSQENALARNRIEYLRLFIHGDMALSAQIYLWLFQHLKKIVIQAADVAPGAAAGCYPVIPGTPPTLTLPHKVGGKKLILGPENLRPAGFGDKDALLPYSLNSSMGYRLLQEYFCFPLKFMFADVTGLAPLSSLDIQEHFEISFHLGDLPDIPLRLTKDNFQLYCTPIVNLFGHEADPIRVEHDKVEYWVRPSGADPEHYEIYSLDKVTGWVHGTNEQRTYQPFLSFAHNQDASGPDSIHYHTRRRASVMGRAAEIYIAFMAANQGGVIPPTETISLELTCTNSNLPEQLHVGDVNMAAGDTPDFVNFRNITRLSPHTLPPLEGDLPWRLISHLSLNYLSLTNVDALRGILALYSFSAGYNQQAAQAAELRCQGILSIRASSREWLYRGAPVRGMAVELEMAEDNFAGEGDMYLFASVLNEFFALYTTLNSFCQLTVKGVKYGRVYRWPPRAGRQTLL